jgi:hypothetical protein
MSVDSVSEVGEDFFICSVGAFDNIFYECLSENYYLLHKDARIPRVFQEIKQGDTLILYYANRCVAAGKVSHRERLEESEKNGWCNIVHVEKWFLRNPKNPKEGVGTYGIKWNLESGSSARLSVKKIKSDFGRKLLLKMLGMTSLKREEEQGFFIVSPQDIAFWHGFKTPRPEIIVGVPVLQRGLVWSPQQNELLWDSLMRGIPIGSFVVCAAIEAQKKGDSRNVTHHLLDGQQRTNAIALGFNENPEDNDSILWVDLNPSDEDLKQTKTRSFLIRITTPAHPWGYRRTDETGKTFCLDTAERREALRTQQIAKSNQKPKVTKMYPHMACCPVPLFMLVKAAIFYDEEDKFWKSVVNYIENNSHLALPRLEKIKEIVESLDHADQRSRIFNGIKTAISSTFVALNTPRSLFLEETAQENISAQIDGIAGIEHLFNRLNRQGTRLEGEELIYSMIKAYWPEVAEKIDACSMFRMPASRMLNLSVRTALSEKSLHSNITVSQIRTIATRSEKDSDKKKVQEFLNQNLENVCERVDQWFGYEKGEPVAPWALPKILRTGIARNAPEIYLLLMWLAKNDAKLDGRWVTSLTILLYLFDVRTRRSSRRWSIITGIVERCRENKINEEEIKAAIFDSVKQRDLVLPVEIKPSKITFEGWEEFFGESYLAMSRVIWNKDVLLYATRDFLKANFPDYDPARKDLWAQENRPWDDDHIIPQDWINKYRGNYKKHCELLKNSIGNFAPIPFSVNRGKSNENNWSYYERAENKDRLYFKGSVSLLNDKTYPDFAEKTILRLLDLYNQIWSANDGLNLEALTDLSGVQSVKIRKNIFSNLKKDISGSRIYYVSGNKEFELNENRQWFSGWLTVGIPVCKDRAIACITSNGSLFECGIRKKPGEESLDQKLLQKFYEAKPPWWYSYEKIDNCNVDESSLVTRINKIIQDCS